METHLAAFAFAKLEARLGFSANLGAGLRIQWGNPCRFKSCLSHLTAKASGLSGGFRIS